MDAKQESLELILHDNSFLGLRLRPYYSHNNSKLIKVMTCIKVIGIESVKRGKYNEIVRKNIEIGDKLSHVDDIPITYNTFSEVLDIIRNKRPIKLTFLKKMNRDGYFFVDRYDSAFKKQVKTEVEEINVILEDIIAKIENQDKNLSIGATYYQELISQNKLKELNKLCFFHGVPEIPNLRFQAWKKLLNFDESRTDKYKNLNAKFSNIFVNKRP